MLISTIILKKFIFPIFNNYGIITYENKRKSTINKKNLPNAHVEIVQKISAISTKNVAHDDRLENILKNNLSYQNF